MGRGLQRISPLFTAFIQPANPSSRSPRQTGRVGVEPDVKVPVEKALLEAHLLALRRLLERERDPNWQENLRRSITELANVK